MRAAKAREHMAAKLQQLEKQKGEVEVARDELKVGSRPGQSRRGRQLGFHGAPRLKAELSLVQFDATPQHGSWRCKQPACRGREHGAAPAFSFPCRRRPQGWSGSWPWPSGRSTASAASRRRWPKRRSGEAGRVAAKARLTSAHILGHSRVHQAARWWCVLHDRCPFSPLAAGCSRRGRTQRATRPSTPTWSRCGGRSTHVAGACLPWNLFCRRAAAVISKNTTAADCSTSPARLLCW